MNKAPFKYTLLVHWLRNKSQLIFWLLVFIGLFCHCLTVSYSPLHWMDEVQIMELARGGIGRKSEDWSMCIVNFNYRDMAWAPYYLGSLICNWAYMALGRLGPRLTVLAFLAFFAWLVRIYVVRKSGDGLLATLMGIIAFCYPALTQSVRGGRVDVIAFTFWAMALLLTSAGCTDHKKEFLVAFGVGAFSAMAVFSWITVVMVLPIVFWDYLERLWGQRKSVLMISCSLTGAFAGLFIIALALLFPFFGRFHEMLELFRGVSNGNLPMSTHSLVKDFILCFISFPYILLLGIICLICRIRSYGYLAAFVAFLLICIQTKIYVFRLLYFLPFALVGIGLFYSGTKKAVLKRTMLVLLAGMATYEYSWSIVLRNGSELFMREFRNHDNVRNELKKQVGMDENVINDSYQLYYIGCNLAWRQYNSGFMPMSLIKKLGKDDKCKFYICEKKHLTPKLEDELGRCGFSCKGIICEYELKDLNSVLKIIKEKGRLFQMGPYCIFKRGV